MTAGSTRFTQGVAGSVRADEFDAVLGGGIDSHYQPIVRLSDRRPIGYEALARGPVGTSLGGPSELFAAARERGRETELDWACRRAALEGALAGDLGADQALFFNVEPSTVGSDGPPGSDELLQRALGEFSVVVELTERSLTERPTELIRRIDQLRADGARIALDDVGADPRSLALMPFVSPEVIKLDLRLMQGRPSPEIAEVVHAVSAEAERTGALVVAEGIESEEHVKRALALGAVYGQGWLFGHPAPLPPPSHSDSSVSGWMSRRGPRSGIAQTPFELVAAEREIRRGDKRLLLELSRSLESLAMAQGPTAVILSTFQDADFFTPRSVGKYTTMATKAALVGALAVGLSDEPAPGVRGASLDAAEPLRGEWDVTVMGPHFAAAFVARDLGDGGGDYERRFDFAMTYDRALVTRAAASLMQRLAAGDPGPGPAPGSDPS